MKHDHIVSADGDYVCLTEKGTQCEILIDREEREALRTQSLPAQRIALLERIASLVSRENWSKNGDGEPYCPHCGANTSAPHWMKCPLWLSLERLAEINETIPSDDDPPKREGES